MATFAHIASAVAGACAMSVSTLFCNALTSRAEWGWTADMPGSANFTCMEGNTIGCFWTNRSCDWKDADNYKCTVGNDEASTCNVLELKCKSCDDHEIVEFGQLARDCLEDSYYLEWTSSPSCTSTPPVIPHLCPITTSTKGSPITASTEGSNVVGGSTARGELCVSALASAILALFASTLAGAA